MTSCRPRRRDGGATGAIGVLAALLLFGAPAFAAEPARTEPGHLHPPPEDPPTFEQTAPMWWPKKPQVVTRANKSWRTAGKVDRALSQACSNHRFTERIFMLFRAVYVDDVLGVAFGHGLNLYDPDHKAKPELIYLFRFGSTTGCLVLTTKNLDPAAAPADPGAKPR